MKIADSYKGVETLENMNQAKFYNKWTLNKFKKYLKGDILEIGCGIGNFTLTLDKFGSLFAIDIDQSLIDVFKKKSPQHISAGYGDIEKGKYFFNKKNFDTIVCINVLEHINNDKKALQNIYNLLKKNGRLILLVPIHEFLYGEIDRSISHFRRYDPDQLRKTLEKIGFKIENSRKLNFLGALGWFFAGKILRNRQIDNNKIKLFNIFAPFFLLLENLVEPIIGTSVLIIGEKR